MMCCTLVTVLLLSIANGDPDFVEVAMLSSVVAHAALKTKRERERGSDGRERNPELDRSTGCPIPKTITSTNNNSSSVVCVEKRDETPDKVYVEDESICKTTVFFFP